MHHCEEQRNDAISSLVELSGERLPHCARNDKRLLIQNFPERTWMLTKASHGFRLYIFPDELEIIKRSRTFAESFYIYVTPAKHQNDEKNKFIFFNNKE